MNSTFLNNQLGDFLDTAHSDDILKFTGTPQFGFYYGPYIGKHPDLIKEKMEIVLQNPITLLFYLLGDIDLHITRGSPLKSVRDAIAKLLLSADNEMGDVYESFGTTLMSNFEKFKRDNRVFENAMINCSPIIPYAGTVQKHPLVTENVASSLPKSAPVGHENDCINLLIKFIRSIINGNFTFNKHLNVMLEACAFDILQNLDLMLISQPHDKFPAGIDKLLNPNSTVLPFVRMYYFLSYIYNYEPSDLNEVIEYLEEYKQRVLGVFDMNGASTLESAIEFLSKDDNTEYIEYLASQENWEHMSNELRRQIEEVSNYNIDPDESDFDIFELTNYIYNSRKYKYDEYINSLFITKNPDLEIYSLYHNNLLVVQMQDKYILSPVVDLADNYNTKIIWLNPEGEIFISKGLVANEEDIRKDDESYQ